MELIGEKILAGLNGRVITLDNPVFSGKRIHPNRRDLRLIEYFGRFPGLQVAFKTHTRQTVEMLLKYSPNGVNSYCFLAILPVGVSLGVLQAVLTLFLCADF